MVVQADDLTVAANVVGSHYDSGGGSFAAGICGWFEQMDSLFNSVKWTERQVKGEECEERGIEKKGLRKEKVNAIGVKHVFCHVHITGATIIPLPVTTSSEALLSLSLSRMASRTERTTRELIQTLPQELFALIYEEVFTATPASIFVLKHEVRHRRILFPTALHVDGASRASHARSFFAVTQFIFRRPEEIRSWLAVVDTLKTNSGVLVEHARGWVIESARDWVIEPARDWEFIC